MYMLNVQGIEIALFSLVAFAIGYIPVKRLSRTYGATKSSLLILIFGIVPLVLSVYFLKPPIPSQYSLLLAAASGAFSGFGYLFFFRTLESENLSTSSGLFAIQPLILLAFGIAVLSEPVTATNIVGVALILMGIWFVTAQKGLKISRAYVYGILGTVLWAIFWIVFSYAVRGSQQVIFQLTVARIASIIVLYAYMLFLAKPAKQGNIAISGKDMALSFTGGVFNGLGSLAYALLLLVNFLALGSVIISMSPILLVFFGYLIYKERPRRSQIMGVLLAVAGALLIAL